MLRLSPTVKSLLIINVVIFIAQMLFKQYNLGQFLAMYRLGSVYFAPYQFFTYMFAHAGFTHILFNMLGLAFLGVSLEMVWGARKFLAFYIITGMGAGIFYTVIGYVGTVGLKSDLREYTVDPSLENFVVLVNDHRRKFESLQFNGPGSTIYDIIETYEKNPEEYKSESVRLVRDAEDIFITHHPGRVIGASGAVYGILMAFGMLFPDRQLMLLFPPIPIKAKYLVLILGGMAIYMGMQRSAGDQVAHLAHLGGMVFGYIMVKFF
ncbi:MAG: rhomboid family intramembrane serine protease [Cyclobacteriaceae bacterium]|nr:rhomboid family intramembrane serine protease [Cyclobacteriaceae bacterium]